MNRYRCNFCGGEKTPFKEKSGSCWRCLRCRGAASLEYYHRTKGPPNPRAAPRPIHTFDGADRSRREWDRNNKEKRRAHKIVENAIVAGHIERLPCERCGDENTHAHHDDYSRPLEVMWLCPKHHKARHKELRIPAGSSADGRGSKPDLARRPRGRASDTRIQSRRGDGRGGPQPFTSNSAEQIAARRMSGPAGAPYVAGPRSFAVIAERP